MSSFLRSNIWNMEVAELKEMEYPSSTYLVAVTSQANQRWLKAALPLSR